jgi:hypothetical protein
MTGMTNSKAAFEFGEAGAATLRDLLHAVVRRWRAAWCAIGDAADGAERDAAFDLWRREDLRLRRVFRIIGADVREFYEREKFSLFVLRRLHENAARRRASVTGGQEKGGAFTRLWRGGM